MIMNRKSLKFWVLYFHGKHKMCGQTTQLVLENSGPKLQRLSVHHHSQSCMWHKELDPMLPWTKKKALGLVLYPWRKVHHMAHFTSHELDKFATLCVREIDVHECCAVRARSQKESQICPHRSSTTERKGWTVWIYDKKKCDPEWGHNQPADEQIACCASAVWGRSCQLEVRTFDDRQCTSFHQNCKETILSLRWKSTIMTSVSSHHLRLLTCF